MGYFNVPWYIDLTDDHQSIYQTLNNGNVVILAKFASLPVLEVVKTRASSAASD